ADVRDRGMIGAEPEIAQHVGQPQEVAGTDERVDLGQLGRQLFAVALGETAGDDELGAMLALVPRHLEDGIDRLFLRRLDEAAGVDEHDARGGGVERRLVALGNELAEHDLGVDLILRTAEAREVDLARHGYPFPSVPGRLRPRYEPLSSIGGTGSYTSRERPM